MKYKLIIAYDGTKYSGWQIQNNGRSIQGALEETLRIIIREDVRVIGSGRTDAGVHALGQVAHFQTQDQNLDTRLLKRSLNGILPSDIRILDASEVEDNFHAQYSTKYKIYHYHLHLDDVENPFSYKYHHHIKGRFDKDILASAAKHFIGTHNFTSFANKADQGSASRNPIRTIKRIDIVEKEGGLRLEFEGNGFLYKMVRNITGTLIAAASGKLALEDIPIIMKGCDRRLAPMSAPAKGLFLVKVGY